MDRWIPIVIFVLVVLALTLWLETNVRKQMRKYWSRWCTGAEWRKRFPDAPKQAIREFIQQFTDGFALSKKTRLKFSPDDKVMDIYRARNPIKNWPDCLELEYFARNLERKYGVDLLKVWRQDIYLGEIFAMTRKNAHQRS